MKIYRENLPQLTMKGYELTNSIRMASLYNNNYCCMMCTSQLSLWYITEPQKGFEGKLIIMEIHCKHSVHARARVTVVACLSVRTI